MGLNTNDVTSFEEMTNELQTNKTVETPIEKVDSKSTTDTKVTDEATDNSTENEGE